MLSVHHSAQSLGSVSIPSGQNRSVGWGGRTLTVYHVGVGLELPHCYPAAPLPARGAEKGLQGLSAQTLSPVPTAGSPPPSLAVRLVGF